MRFALSSCCALFLLVSVVRAAAKEVVPAPPMGWNSWDSYGLTVTESEFKENATWLAAHLKPYGWQYAVVDEGWYLPDPEAKPGSFHFVVNENGLYTPALNRFGSAASGAGFRELARWTHSNGLKFGIHIIRGIPKEAVTRNLPIAHSVFHAAEAADTADVCPWNADNYGVKANAAGQAYYDSLARLYADWGVDFVKVDCIAAHPYKGDEIRMIHEAIGKTGYPIALSLSPGPAPLAQAADLAKYAQMWRMSDDVWDHWAHDPAIAFSQSVSQQFAVAASWAPYAADGHWPDADMLPIGFLGPRPGLGKARSSKLTYDEQRTMVTAWSIFRSPLILGCNLTKMDRATEALLENPEVVAVNQTALGQHQVSSNAEKIVWTSNAADRGIRYLAVFNLREVPQQFDLSWSSLNFPGGQHAVRDLWMRKDLGTTSKLRCVLPPHGSTLYKISLH